jgi:hypothetical protein
MIGIVIPAHKEEAWIEDCVPQGRARLCRSAWTVRPRGRAGVALVTRALGELAAVSIEAAAQRLQGLAPAVT